MSAFLENYTLLKDSEVFFVAVISVIFVGLGKGGLGGAFSLIGVPLLALKMPTLQAAALLLPSYLIMDGASLFSWRGYYKVSILKSMIPGALIGTLIAWASASIISDNAVKIIVGLIGLVFTLRHFTKTLTKRSRYETTKENAAFAVFWGAISGFTSFVAHAGMPPYQVYTLPLNMDPKIFTGTSVIFFAIVNLFKVIPYFALGTMQAEAFYSALILMPFAVGCTLIGAFIVKRMSVEVFYPFMYAMVIIVSVKLILDGFI